jgi:hypothetical protein
MITLLLLLAAQEPAATATEAAAPEVTPPPLLQDEYTAFTVRGGQLKLGVLAIEYGLTDWWSIGTDPPAWALRSVTHVLVPNAHTELALVRSSGVQVSVMAAGYYADLSKSNWPNAQLLTVPLSLFVSGSLAGLTDSWTWLHLEGSYNFLHAFGTGSTDRAEVEGTVATRSLQLGAMFEQRIWRGLSLTLRGRVQAWTTPLVLEGEATIDPFTRAELMAELRPARDYPWAVVAAVTYSWKHVLLRVGGGYGAYFVHGMNVVLPYFGIIPDGELAIFF